MNRYIKMKFKSHNQRKAVMASLNSRRKNPAIKIKHNSEIGVRISDIGAGGKEYNIREDNVYKKKNLIEVRRQGEAKRMFGTNFYKLPIEEQELIQKKISIKKVNSKSKKETYPKISPDEAIRNIKADDIKRRLKAEKRIFKDLTPAQEASLPPVSYKAYMKEKKITRNK